MNELQWSRIIREQFEERATKYYYNLCFACVGFAIKYGQKTKVGNSAETTFTTGLFLQTALQKNDLIQEYNNMADNVKKTINSSIHPVMNWH